MSHYRNHILLLLAIIWPIHSLASQVEYIKTSKPLVPYADGTGIKSQFVPGKGSMIQGVKPDMDIDALNVEIKKMITASLPEGFELGTAQTSRVTPPTNKDEKTAAATAPDQLVTRYPLVYRGIPLMRGSEIVMVHRIDGQVISTRTRLLPTKVDGTVSTVKAETALTVVRSNIEKLAPGHKIVLEEAQLQIWVDSENTGRLTWTITARDNADLANPLAIRYWVAALGEPIILQSENLVMYGVQGTVSATLWETTPFQATANHPLEQLNISNRFWFFGGATTTDQAGHYNLPSFLAGPVNAHLIGPWANVQTQASGNTNLALSASSPWFGSSTVNLNFAPTAEADLAQTSAFFWVNKVHRFAQPILPGLALANMQVLTTINQSCNAFFNGNLNFFRAGSGCPNTAYSDVVAHEFGHAVDNANGGILDGSYSEGFGDAMAILLTHQPCTGRELFGAATCLRDATSVLLWPAPVTETDPHMIGWRYAGFVWELINQLRSSHTESNAYAIATSLIFGAAAQNPSNIPDAVLASFIFDDDDGDLTTCSAHFRELAAAADSRTIPRPANCHPRSGPNPQCLKDCKADRDACLATHGTGGNPLPSQCVQIYKACIRHCQ